MDFKAMVFLNMDFDPFLNHPHKYEKFDVCFFNPSLNWLIYLSIKNMELIFKCTLGVSYDIIILVWD